MVPAVFKWNVLALLLAILLCFGDDRFRVTNCFRPSLSSSTFRRSVAKNKGPGASSPRLQAGWQDKLQELFSNNKKGETETATFSGSDDRSTTGIVLRVAAKAFDKESSKPSSRSYTTRKVELESYALVTKNGVQGDYNHYRTVALKSTTNRAVSFLTNDVMKALRSEYPNYDIQDGDLGENILVDSVGFDFFRIGQRYKLASSDDDDNDDAVIVVEITEKMDPCANLCKLSYINDASLEPKDRIARCQSFLNFLDRYDGYRGWYAKVLKEGTMQRDAKVLLMDD